MQHRISAIIGVALLLLIAGAQVCPVLALEPVDAHHGTPRANRNVTRATLTLRVYDAQQHLLCEGSGCAVSLVQPHGAPLRGVATCRHLFAGAASAEVQTADGKTLALMMSAEDVAGDLVLLTGDFPSSSLAPLAITTDTLYAGTKAQLAAQADAGAGELSAGEVPRSAGFMRSPRPSRRPAMAARW